MKKIFTVIIAIVLAFSMSVAVFAEVENFAKDTKWVKGHSGGVSTKEGITKATGINAAYCSPFIDIYPAVKAALGTDTEAEMVIKFKMRADFSEGNEGEVSSARTLIRGGSLEKEEIDDWNAAYEEAVDGETFFKADGGGNIMSYIGSGFSFTDDEWTVVLIEFTVTDAIVNCDMVKNWNFCIDSIANAGIVEAIYFKDFIVALSDDSLFDDTDSEPVEGLEKPAKTPKPESNEPVSNEPASDENFAAGLKWSGFAGATVTEADGVVTVTGFKYAYSSPSIEILSAVKKALGSDDDVELYIVFESRGVFTEGNEGATVSATTLIRGTNALSVKPSDIEEWREAYQDSFEESDPYFGNNSGNIMKYLGYSVKLTSEWTQHVIPLELEAEQVKNPSISKWTFCMDNMTADYTLLDRIEIKNFTITLTEPEVEEEEEPEEKPADKPAQVVVDPNATPTPYVVWATPIGYKADNSNVGGGDSGNDGGNGGFLGIIVAAAAVVVVGTGAVGALVVLKKKKKTDE